VIKILLVDFDGVMSKSKFYDGYPEEYEKEFSNLLKQLFESSESGLRDSWMRGAVRYSDVHAAIANDPKIASIYDEVLVESVKNIKLNQTMLRTVCRVRDAGVRVALFTDNMDVFDDIAVGHFRLLDHFDAVYSSSQHGKLKFEDDSLFRKAASSVDANPEEVALVDDSTRSMNAMEQLGGKWFHYANYDRDHPLFEAWIDSLLRG
jgi:FMN phosphatase YigB (HAD superfamily)